MVSGTCDPDCAVLLEIDTSSFWVTKTYSEVVDSAAMFFFRLEHKRAFVRVVRQEGRLSPSLHRLEQECSSVATQIGHWRQFVYCGVTVGGHFEVTRYI